MKKCLALFILVALGLILVQSSISAPVAAQTKSSSCEGGSPEAPLPPLIYRQSGEETSCDAATVYYLSMPPKCLTSEGLKVAVEPMPKFIPARKP